MTFEELSKIHYENINGINGSEVHCERLGYEDKCKECPVKIRRNEKYGGYSTRPCIQIFKELEDEKKLARLKEILK